jgi:hypothetical protein
MEKGIPNKLSCLEEWYGFTAQIQHELQKLPTLQEEWKQLMVVYSLLEAGNDGILTSRERLPAVIAHMSPEQCAVFSNMSPELRAVLSKMSPFSRMSPELCFALPPTGTSVEVFSCTSESWFQGEVTESNGKRITIAFTIGSIPARKVVQWPNTDVRHTGATDKLWARKHAQSPHDDTAANEVDPGLTGIEIALPLFFGLCFGLLCFGVHDD